MGSLCLKGGNRDYVIHNAEGSSKALFAIMVKNAEKILIRDNVFFFFERSKRVN